MLKGKRKLILLILTFIVGMRYELDIGFRLAKR